MNLQNLVPIPELYVSHESAQKLKLDAADLASWDLTPRQICDLELLRQRDVPRPFLLAHERAHGHAHDPPVHRRPPRQDQQ